MSVYICVCVCVCVEDYVKMYVCGGVNNNASDSHRNLAGGSESITHEGRYNRRPHHEQPCP